MNQFCVHYIPFHVFKRNLDYPIHFRKSLQLMKNITAVNGKVTVHTCADMLL